LEEIFSAFFEKSISPSAVSVGPEHRFLFVNEAWVRLFGYSKEEAIGKDSRELGINRNPVLTENLLRQLNASGSIREAALVLYDRSGAELHVLNNITRMTLDGRDYILSSLQDVTLQKMTEVLRQQHDATLLEELTRRERDVLKLAIAGYSNKDIAARLGISYRTVEVHRSHCIRKLGTRSLIQIKEIAESGHL
jgi:PAS domain S-box-containing protein